MEQEEDELWEDRCYWIRMRLGEEADQYTAGWDELSDEFDAIHLHDDLYDDTWTVVGKTRFEIFYETVEAARSIIAVELPTLPYKNLTVMVYAHIVAAIESYLSSTFIEEVLASESNMRRLVESDPEFAKRKFTIKEIFVKREELKDDLRKYLKELIFHDIAKVKPMYSSVLDIDFGDVKWLFQAVALRHDCVHRAGYDKEGKEVDISKETITELMDKAITLVNYVELAISSMSSIEEVAPFWENVQKIDI